MMIVNYAFKKRRGDYRGQKTLYETIEELSLVLLYLTRFQDNNEFCRYMEVAWRGYDFTALNQLENKGLIMQPR